MDIDKFKSIKLMKLDDLKEVLDEMYGFDIANPRRYEEYVYARKVFVRVARDYGYGWVDMTPIIGFKHDLCIYHYSTFNVVNAKDIDKYNACIEYFELPLDKIPSMSWFNNGKAVSRLMEKLSVMTPKDLLYFEEHKVNLFLEKLRKEADFKAMHHRVEKPKKREYVRS